MIVYQWGRRVIRIPFRLKFWMHFKAQLALFTTYYSRQLTARVSTNVFRRHTKLLITCI